MTPLHVGITGTRRMLPDLQWRALGGVLAGITMGAEGRQLVGHHGVCEGADEASHEIMREIGCWRIHGHPGHDADGNSPWRARSIEAGCDVLHPVLPYGSRNEDITIACPLLVAAPLYPEDHPQSYRSGTWQTIRMARDRERRIVLVWRDGKISTEGRGDA